MFVEEDRKSWTALAAASTTGQIGTLILTRENEDEIRKVWEFTEQVKDRDVHLICSGGRISSGGAEGEDLADADWQHLLAILV